MKRLFLFILFLMSISQAFADCGNDTIKRTVGEEVAQPTNTVSKAIHQWLQQHQCKVGFEVDNGCIVGFEYQDNLYLVGADDANDFFVLSKILYLENEVYSFLNQKGYLQQYLESANRSFGIKADVNEVKGSDQYQISLQCEMFTFGHAIEPYMERALRLVNHWRKEIYPYYNIYLETKNAEAKEKQE